MQKFSPNQLPSGGEPPLPRRSGPTGTPQLSISEVEVNPQRAWVPWHGDPSGRRDKGMNKSGEHSREPRASDPPAGADILMWDPPYWLSI